MINYFVEYLEVKKAVFCFSFLFFSFFAFGNISIKTGLDSIYSDGTVSFSGYYLKSDLVAKNGLFATAQVNFFELENVCFTLNDYADYFLGNFNILTGYSCFGIKVNNPFIKSIGIDLFGANSSAENGRICKGRANYLNLIPELENTYGFGTNLELPWNLNFSAQEFFLAAKTVSFITTEDSVEENNAFIGQAKLTLFDVSKQFYLKNDSLKFHAGSLFGNGTAGGELLLNVFLQKKIILGVKNFDFSSLYGTVSYSHWWKFLRLNLMTGMIYFPQMNLSYFLKDGTLILGWHYKSYGTVEEPLSLDLLKNYGIIPVSVGSELKFPIFKTELNFNVTKSLIIPVKFTAINENFNPFQNSSENLKEILLRSGWSIYFSLNI